MTKTALSYKDWLSGLAAGDHVIIRDTWSRSVSHRLATISEVTATKIVATLPSGNPISFSRASGRASVGCVRLHEATEELRAQAQSDADMRAMRKACNTWLETNQRSDLLSPQSLKILHEAIQAIEAIETEA